jgi:hypothetical protein
MEEPTTTMNKEVMAVLEFNKEHAHFFPPFGGGVKGVVHHEFVPPNAMVNSDSYLYCDILRRLRENV